VGAPARDGRLRTRAGGLIGGLTRARIEAPAYAGRVSEAAQAATPYERIGGAEGVRKLVDSFYDHMRDQAFAAAILKMHPEPESLVGSRDKFFDFLSGWLGGPQLYVEKRGHPRLRMRHMPFAVDDEARDAWMSCMRLALEECVEDKLLRELLRGSFQRVADHMRNVEAR
jgi:hemoglobin